MRVDDWRTASPDEMAPCYAAECARWRATLGWETGRTWEAVEAARRAGLLPGFVLRDTNGAIRGWSFHLLHRGQLQLGSLVAPSPGATGRLIDALLQSSEARSASQWMAFGWFDAPDLVTLLRQHGAAVESYRYLSRSLSRDLQNKNTPDVAVRSWRLGDESRLAPLLSSAYNGADAARPFAANGTMTEWIEYSAHLLHGSACGTFDAGISRVSGRDDQMDGAAVMMRLMPTTAHLAQLAVRQEAQRRGLGERLLLAACSAAGLAGCDSVTLLVRQTNHSAQHLYARLGFVERARFLSASSAIGHRLPAVS